MILWPMDRWSPMNPNGDLRDVSPQRELTHFAATLFEANDRIELRLIYEPQSGAVRRIERRWCTSSELVANVEWLRRRNAAGGHIFFGVNPRRYYGGTKDAVHACRVIWVDLDQVMPEEAAFRWQKVLPDPSLLVDSGHGVHAYWLLDEPWDVSTVKSLQEFEGLLQGLYADLGADATQDVSRLLRLPGFVNFKAPPAPCRLLVCRPELRYPRRLFDAWRPEPRPTAAQNPLDLAQHRMPRSPSLGRLHDVLFRLRFEVVDRSRRDFGVVCDLQRLGLDREFAWKLVSPYSKFATDGRAYFDRTWRSAARRLGER